MPSLKLAIAVTLLIAWSGIPSAGAIEATRGEVHQSSPRLVLRCTSAGTETLVRRFVHYYALGRVRVINRMWAPEPRFQWFSSGPPGDRAGAEAENRATLARYFRTRVRVHERLRLTKLGAGYDPKRRIVNFGGKLVRSARDMHSRLPQDFKGAADCVSGRPRFIVWSM
jgi:hypothetical protein